MKKIFALIASMLFIHQTKAQTEVTKEQYNETKTNKDMEKIGWEVILIEGTDYLPSFGYTIGLTKNYQHPEIICFGLSIETLHAVLNEAGELAKAGKKIEIGKDYPDFFEKGKSQFIRVDTSSLDDYFGHAIDMYEGLNFKAIQLVWTDTKNKLPWEAGFETKFNFKQPLLDRNMNFKFGEEKNAAVLTTKQFLEMNQPILRVLHDKDGEWQFLTKNQNVKDVQVVGLGRVVQQDLTLNEVFDLDFGESAERTEIGG